MILSSNQSEYVLMNILPVLGHWQILAQPKLLVYIKNKIGLENQKGLRDKNWTELNDNVFCSTR